MLTFGEFKNYSNAGIPVVKEIHEEPKDKTNCDNCAGPLTRHLENCEYCRCINPNFKIIPPPILLPPYPVEKKEIKPKQPMTAGILAMTIAGGLVPLLMYDQIMRKR